LAKNGLAADDDDLLVVRDLGACANEGARDRDVSSLVQPLSNVTPDSPPCSGVDSAREGRYLSKSGGILGPLDDGALQGIRGEREKSLPCFDPPAVH
jgi:hypothetical protein